VTAEGRKDFRLSIDHSQILYNPTPEAEFRIALDLDHFPHLDLRCEVLFIELKVVKCEPSKIPYGSS
jgi:hypothetical protein